MRPVKLKVENVFQHRSLEYDFQTGITGVTGRNGSGKSNFLEALHFAITGQTESNVKKEDLLSWGASSGKTIFEFKHNGHSYSLTRKVDTSLVKLESDQWEKPLKAAEANAYMESVLGMSFKGFYETCWTPQGTLVSILICSHAQRVAYFQRLAHTRQAEVVRGIIQENGINKLPNYPDRSEEISGMQTEIITLGQQVQEAETSSTKLDGLLQEYKQEMPGVQKILALPTQTQHDQKVQQLAQQHEQAKTALTNEQETSGLQEVPAAEPPSQEVEQARQAYEQARQLQQRKQGLEKQLEDWKTRMPPPVTEPDTAGLEKLNKEVSDLYPRYQLARQGVCPTCERPYEFEGGEQGRQQIIQEYEKKAAEAAQLKTTISQQQVQYSDFQQKTASAQGQIQAITADLDQVNQQLQQVSGVQFDPQSYQQQVQAHQAYSSYLQRKQAAENKLRTLEQSVDRTGTALEAAQNESYADDAAREQAQLYLKNYEELQERRRQAAGTLSAAQARSESLEQQLKKMQAEQERRSAVAHVRRLFEQAREKLHRDYLPKLVMQKVLYGLNALLDQYLSIFDTEFTAYIDENFDFQCSFATKSDVPARALSGGQKVALALAFQFAVSDLTASAVPIMVLDEPTIWLDEINKPRLAEVLTKAREVTEKGVFVLVATHEQLLFPSFSRIFDVAG